MVVSSLEWFHGSWVQHDAETRVGVDSGSFGHGCGRRKRALSVPGRALHPGIAIHSLVNTPDGVGAVVAVSWNEYWKALRSDPRPKGVWIECTENRDSQDPTGGRPVGGVCGLQERRR